MDAATVGALMTGLVTLITTVGGLMLNRQKQRVDSVLDLETEVIELRGRIESALRYIHVLRTEMSTAGLEPPDVPVELVPRRRAS